MNDRVGLAAQLLPRQRQRATPTTHKASIGIPIEALCCIVYELNGRRAIIRTSVARALLRLLCGSQAGQRRE